MDLFDLVDNPQVGNSAEKKCFNWEEFKAGKPALSRDGQVAYFGGQCTHPLNTHRFIAIMTVPDDAIIKYGKEVMPYVIDERGWFEGTWGPLLVEMA